MDPGAAVRLSNQGAVLNAAGQHAVAEMACRAALDLYPGFWAALGNLGTSLHRQQRLAEAVCAYSESLRGNPGNVDACTNLGVVLAEQWRMRDALAVHDAAVAMAPEDAEIRCNRALALLAAGDYRQGFAENEWRWQVPGMRAHGVPGEQWRGGDLAGRTILLHDEGGFGDTLQFIRYAPLLAARGARVVARVQAPLVRLLRHSLPGIAVISGDAKLPAYDLHCPMVSLPFGFGTTLATVPAQTPYLAAPPKAAAAWRRRLKAHAAADRLRVGLVWAGAARPSMAWANAMDARRSITPLAFASLLKVQNIGFVSLQHGTAASCHGLDLFNPMAEMTDFADTAALVGSLDLVISVDTAVAHLAGALGRPVWLLSRHDACWRWLAHRRDSPWYPHLRVYRQPQPGDWTSVLAEVEADLSALAMSKAPPGSARIPPGCASAPPAAPPPHASHRPPHEWRLRS